MILMVMMVVMIIIIIKIVILKVMMTLSTQLEVITKMMKKSRCAIDDAETENYLFKGWLGLI